MNSKLQENFSKKWKLNKDMVYTIYRLIEDYSRKYGKVSRTLKGFNIKLSPRQLKYFFQKERLSERLKIDKKGKPLNYRDLLRKTG